MTRLRPVALLAFATLAVVAACSPPPPPTLGGACTSESAPACDSAAPRMLLCTDKVLKAYSDCKGPAGCALVGDQVTCDTSGNSAGDSCPPTSEGKVRCDPDAGRILRCADGTLTAIYECPPQTQCGVVPDAGLTCR